ncbi:MAG: DoxX family protein [Woeseiaceae bacterium]|nr:DoxX family protein [Woeseiaceae bacterium]
MSKLFSKLTPDAHWLLRAGLASVFLFHGFGKVPNVAGFAETMGLPYTIALLVTFAEIAAGLGIIVGGFGRELITRLATLAMIPVLIGAIALVHGPRWSFTPTEGFPMGGMEFQVVLLLGALYFLIVGNSSPTRQA